MDIDGFMGKVWVAEAYTPLHAGWRGWWPLFSARDELKDRLNQRLLGIDPGDPFHWKGLRGENMV